MTSVGLKSEFDARGLRTGGVLLFDEHSARAFIRRAEEEHIAVVGVDQVGLDARHLYQPLEKRALTSTERLASWHQAHSFVETFSGRGLFFEVALEPPHATYLAKLMYLFRTGGSWSSGSSADDETIQ